MHLLFEIKQQIKRKLKLSPADIPNAWQYVPRKFSKDKGAQIDLLFDRQDDAITLCEIKYTDEPFVITKSYVENLQNKIAVFKEQSRTKKQIFMVMIAANGIKNNFYSDEILSGLITLDDLFLQIN